MFLLVLAAAFFGACASEPENPGVAPASSLPACPDPDLLACSGLYGQNGESWADKQIAADVLAYQPGVQFWSDGLDKRRWVRLPPGTRIDTSNPDGWVYPIGTAFWKEFSHRGRRIETRYMLKVTEQAWYAMAFAWNEDGSDTTPARHGVQNVAGLEDGSYEIPSAESCYRCHGGAVDEVLGFEAIGLAMPNATGLTLEELGRRALLTAPVAKPSIPGDEPTREALAYLHSNCGLACHNATPNAEASWTGLRMRLESGELSTPQATGVFRTAIGVKSGFVPPGEGPFLRIAPGDPEHSALLYRIGQRDSRAQMPPLGTRRIDSEAIARLRSWVQELR